MATLADAYLSERERLALDRLLELLEDRLGDDLGASGSTAHVPAAKRPARAPNIDVTVITTGGRFEDFDRVHAAALEAEPLMAGEETILAHFVADPEWIEGRREIDSFFMQEVDRDKIVLLVES